MFLYFTTLTSHSFHILFLTDQMKRFVSIFQLLGWYKRQISEVFHRNFTTCDNQHIRFSLHKQHVRLQILLFFEALKSHTRKTYLTEPLQRIIEPLQRNILPHCGTIEPLRRKIEHLSSKGKHNCGNIESLCGINKFFLVNQHPALQGESAHETSCQNTVRKSFSDRETIDVKAVVNHYENSHEIIIPRNCHMTDVKYDRSSNERSITMYRLTARKICKQSKINGHLHARDREPSRIPAKKVIQIMRKIKLQQKFKRIIRKTIPTSSKLFHSITYYNLWYINFMHKNLHSFYTAYF